MTKTTRRTSLTSLTLLLVLALAGGEPVVSTEKDETKIEDLAWIAGSWAGTCFGSPCEETWSPPSGNTMLGMFKLLKDGEPVFYEIMLIVREEDGWVLKVKHFHANFHSWETKEDAVVFRLQSAAPGLLDFNGLKMARHDADGLEVTLRMRRGDEVSNELMYFERR